MKEFLKTSALVIGTAFLILTCCLTVAWMADNPRCREAEITVDKCAQQHGKEIMDYVVKCTASLKVEENAYVVSSCESVARSNLCFEQLN